MRCLHFCLTFLHSGRESIPTSFAYFAHFSTGAQAAALVDGTFARTCLSGHAKRSIPSSFRRYTHLSPRVTTRLSSPHAYAHACPLLMPMRPLYGRLCIAGMQVLHEHNHNCLHTQVPPAFAHEYMEHDRGAERRSVRIRDSRPP
jgi:hypothetical protein